MTKAPLAFKIAEEISVAGKGRSFLIPVDHRWFYFRENSETGKLELVNITPDSKKISGLEVLEELYKGCKQALVAFASRVSDLSEDIADLNNENSSIRKTMEAASFPIPPEELIKQLKLREASYRKYIKATNDLAWDLDLLFDRYKIKDEVIPDNIKARTEELFANFTTKPSSSNVSEPEVKNLFDSLKSLVKKGINNEPKSTSAEDSSSLGKGKGEQ